MSSVLIKGMNMPYGCANCDFVSGPIYDAKGYAIYMCVVPVEGIRGKNNTNEVIALYEGESESFPDWCPLVELPEKHGRLVEFVDVETETDDDTGLEEINVGEMLSAYLRMRGAKPVIEEE